MKLTPALAEWFRRLADLRRAQYAAAREEKS